MKDKPNPSTAIRAAIYARVSSEQQTQQSTIASQVAALRERLHTDGLTLEDDLCFLDDGYSGSTLVRPGLERLRDVAWAGGFTRLYVHSPDRLARKYAWQVLLVEELQRSGIELVFPRGTTTGRRRWRCCCGVRPSRCRAGRCSPDGSALR
jgi:site-specific DNA recombinase